MANVNGTDLRLYADGNPIGYATSCTLSLSRETRETVHKDNVGGYSTFEGGKRSASISFEHFYAEDQTLNSATVNSVVDLFDLYAGDSFTWRFSDDVTGHTEFSGSALLTELSFSAPVEENATSSGSFTVTGAVTKSTIA